MVIGTTRETDDADTKVRHQEGKIEQYKGMYVLYRIQPPTAHVTRKLRTDKPIKVVMLWLTSRRGHLILYHNAWNRLLFYHAQAVSETRPPPPWAKAIDKRGYFRRLRSFCLGSCQLYGLASLWSSSYSIRFSSAGLLPETSIWLVCFKEQRPSNEARIASLFRYLLTLATLLLHAPPADVGVSIFLLILWIHWLAVLKSLQIYSLKIFPDFTES